MECLAGLGGLMVCSSYLVVECVQKTGVTKLHSIRRYSVENFGVAIFGGFCFESFPQLAVS